MAYGAQALLAEVTEKSEHIGLEMHPTFLL